MSASFIQRFTKRKLYTAEEVGNMITAILAGTYEKHDVVEAIETIDDFNAGVVDEPLRNHIRKVHQRLHKTDMKGDSERLEIWRKYLVEDL